MKSNNNHITLIVLSILDAIYIIYVLNYFKTKYNIAHPVLYFQSDYFKHPIEKTVVPQSMVCPFGNDASWLLALFVLIRCSMIVMYGKSQSIKYISILVLVMSVLLSLMNFNVLLYLIPHLLVEYYIIDKYLQ